MLSTIFGLLILGLDIWAILNVFKSRAGDGAKVLWTLGIIIAPILGLIVWWFAGPKDQKLLPRG